jgi:hypothetical protein
VPVGMPTRDPLRRFRSGWALEVRQSRHQGDKSAAAYSISSVFFCSGVWILRPLSSLQRVLRRTLGPNSSRERSRHETPRGQRTGSHKHMFLPWCVEAKRTSP